MIKTTYGSFPTEWQPVSVDESWADNASRYYDVYISHGADWRLTFTQANSRNFVEPPEGNNLHFCLMDDHGSDWSCEGDWWGDFSLSSTEMYAPSPGWYTLKVRSNGPWSGTWAAYETGTNVDYGNGIQTPDNLIFDLANNDEPLWLSQQNVADSQSYFVQTDCSNDILIHSNNSIIARNYGDSSLISSSSDGWVNRIAASDCFGLIELEFTPSPESTVHFGIQLDNGNSSSYGHTKRDGHEEMGRAQPKVLQAEVGTTPTLTM